MENKLYRKLNVFFEFFHTTALLLLGFLMIIGYIELILPSLGWLKWIISPIWLISTISLIWNLGYKELFK